MKKEQVAVKKEQVAVKKEQVACRVGGEPFERRAVHAAT